MAEEERFDAELAKQLAARERAQAQNAKAAFMEKKALEFGRKWAQVFIMTPPTECSSWISKLM